MAHKRHSRKEQRGNVEKGAVPDFLRMDQPVSSDPASAMRSVPLINWNNADDNNALHARQIVMDVRSWRERCDPDQYRSRLDRDLRRCH
jgi:hypothetical protein